mmetsp:Transcript_13974/g.38183  ORF Transcript_13974/g.38183 Transcript_13974/m.38183 type:complete len:85 (+) Transcript_13974:155-409(+)
MLSSVIRGSIHAQTGQDPRRPNYRWSLFGWVHGINSMATSASGIIQIEAMVVNRTPKPAENHEGTSGKNFNRQLTSAIKRYKGW